MPVYMNLNNFKLILRGGMKSHAGGRNRVAQKFDALGFEGGLDLVKVSAAVLGDASGYFESSNRSPPNT